MLDLSQRANHSATLALETATDVELIQQSMDQGLLPKLDTLTTNLETADLPTAIQQGVHNRGVSKIFHEKGGGGGGFQTFLAPRIKEKTSLIIKMWVLCNKFVMEDPFLLLFKFYGVMLIIIVE